MSMTPADFTIARRLIGLTAQELSEKLNVQLRSVQRWESGQHPVNDGVAGLMSQLVSEHSILVGEIATLAIQGEQVSLPKSNWNIAAASRVLSSNPEARFDWAE
ncbi:helix-turn-helix domain-containing protein [Glutamicibacter arilaitensis]|uniref:helix-turn-helix domain-containing protein n=1 Tax=Glutamicibacter arilaitensis TaxID=256701 RepID=UPI00384F38F5